MTASCLTLSEDMLVRVCVPITRSALTHLARVAHRRGLERICCIPRLSSRSQLAAIMVVAEKAQAQSRVTIHVGVEVAVCDGYGSLTGWGEAAFPTCSRYLSDCCFPISGDNYSASEIRSLVATGQVSPRDAVQALNKALSSAMVCHCGLVLPTPFAPLERAGLGEDHLTASDIEQLAHVARQTGATIVVSEWARRPSRRVIAALVAAGANVAIGSGSSDPRHLGQYRYCRDSLVAIHAARAQSNSGD